jgi:neuralized-like protein 4
MHFSPGVTIIALVSSTGTFIDTGSCCVLFLNMSLSVHTLIIINLTATNQEPVAEQPQNSAPTPPVTNENWFTLSARHGDQVAVSQDHRVALRINPLVEFNNAVVMSNRPLRDDEMFEVIVLTLVDRWSGSLEAG